MFGRLNTFLQKSFHNLSAKKSILVGEFCGIAISAKEILIVIAQKTANKTIVKTCKSYPYDLKTTLDQVLNTIIKDNNIKNTLTYWVLQAEDYQLFVTDALPVPPAEFQAAIRFKTRDLLRYPLDDVLIDSFPIPKTKMETAAKIMIVATLMSRIKKISDKLINLGFNLRTVTIPEITLSHIAAAYETDEKSTALIYVQEKTIELLITSQKQIYIARNLLFSLTFGADNAANLPSELERLSSEIQRSFGYFQSQWRMPMPERLFFISTKPFPPDLAQQLSEILKLTINIYNVQDHLNIEENLKYDQQGKFLPLLGFLLKKDEAS